MNLSENINNQNSSICEQLSPQDLAYLSSEQYLILCLKICNMIIKNKCKIEDIINHSHNSSIIDVSTNLFSHLNETECQKYGHKESYKLSLFISGISLCLTILAINMLTLITIAKSRKLHTITNILIANLSVSDFLAGIAFLYPCILNMLTIISLETYNPTLYTITCSIRQHYYFCLAGYSPMITSMLSSMLTLTLLALEKYTAIMAPYFYDRYISERRCVVFISVFITWFVSITVSLLPIMGWNERHGNGMGGAKSMPYIGFDCRHTQSMPCMFERIFTLDYILLFTSICGGCALAMLAIYVQIYFVARRHSTKISQIHATVVTKKKMENVMNDDIYDNIHNFDKINAENNDDDEFGNSFSLNEDAKINPKEMITVTTSTYSIHSNFPYLNRGLDDSRTIKKEKQKQQQLITSSYENRNERIVKILKSESLNGIMLKQAANKSNIGEFKLKTSDIISTSPMSTFACSSGSGSDASCGDYVLRTSIICSSENHPKPPSSSSPTPTTHKSFNHNMKAMKTLFILLLGTYVCWLPLIVYFLTFATHKYDNLTIYILMFIACCNAVIDPLVYAFRNKEFCKALFLNVSCDNK